MGWGALYFRGVDDQAYRAESDRLMALLGKILRVRGVSMRAVEQAAGMGPNSLARLLQGKKNAYLSHVFRVLATLGITPGQFFRLAYPDEPLGSPTSLLDPKLEKLATGRTAAEDEQEFRSRVEAAVRSVLEDKARAGLRAHKEAVDDGEPRPVAASGGRK